MLAADFQAGLDAYDRGDYVTALCPSERALVLTVYRRALAALDIPHGEIRRDYLAGIWIDAVTDFRSDGLAEADAEKRADAMIEEVFAAWASPVATWANSRSATNLAIMST